MAFLGACYLALAAAILFALAPRLLGGIDERHDRLIEGCLWAFAAILAIRLTFFGHQFIAFGRASSGAAPFVLTLLAMMPFLVVSFCSHWAGGRYGWLAAGVSAMIMIGGLSGQLA